MKFFRGFYTGYALLIFFILFLIFFILLLIPIVFQKQHQLVGIFNRWWARAQFFLTLLPVRIEWRFKPDAHRQYIFCPNHFSYLDIPVMALNSHNTIFVGKNDMENIPLFGFMYRKLHITVDRSKLKSKFNSFLRSCQAIDEGKSLVIYPEGGILSEEEPVLSRLKDGAFRVAVEKQIPLVPVTIPFNRLILPPNQFLLRWGIIKLIFHEPIQTQGLSVADIPALKHQLHTIIQSELDKQYANR